MKHIKKLSIVLIIFLVAAVGLSGCGGGGNPPMDIPDNIDLTTMSEAVAHARVSDINSRPHAYVDVTIKASGIYAIWENEHTGEVHHYIWIESASCGCAAWIDFYYADVHTLEEGMILLIEGVFSEPTTTTNHYHLHLTSLTIVS